MATLSRCICRIFDSSGRLVAVSHHLGAYELAVLCCAVLFPVPRAQYVPTRTARLSRRCPSPLDDVIYIVLASGKNPYGELDVLSSMPQSQLGGALQLCPKP